MHPDRRRAGRAIRKRRRLARERAVEMLSTGEFAYLARAMSEGIASAMTMLERELANVAEWFAHSMKNVNTSPQIAGDEEGTDRGQDEAPLLGQ